MLLGMLLETGPKPGRDYLGPAAVPGAHTLSPSCFSRARWTHAVCLLTVKSSRKCLGISNSRARSLQLCWRCFSLRLRDYPLTLRRGGAPLATGLQACDCRGAVWGQRCIWGPLEGAGVWIPQG